tara:strand:- start:562 stop:783 length:222 start_codon:yes stop_codon:yes gene_type:complete
MRAIVEYRKSVYSPILAEFNVSGRGHNHIQEKCHLYGSMRDYGYWSIVYNLENADFGKLMQKRGTPYIQKRVK